MSVFLELLELVGTAAFAVSGAMLGLKKQMDLFGVCMMGLVTACGGGMLRDLFLGSAPPAVFRDPRCALVAAGVSAAFFLAARKHLFHAGGPAFEPVMLLAGLPPYIFVKHIYACASIAGGIACALLWRSAGQTCAVLVCFSLVFLIRILAARYRWSLPKAV